VAGYQTDDQRVFLEEKDARSHAHYLRFLEWYNKEVGEIHDVDDLLTILRALREEGFITFTEGWGT
jgi:hypothetical protein